MNPRAPYSGTYSLSRGASSPLEYFSTWFGGEDGIRTHVGLHPNGFQDRPVMTASVPLLKTQKAFNNAICIQYGDPSGTRTRDTLIKSQVLYQLS